MTLSNVVHLPTAQEAEEAKITSRALSKYESEDATKAINHPSSLFVVNGANHTDLYDQEKYVNEAVQKLVDFYKKS